MTTRYELSSPTSILKLYITLLVYFILIGTVRIILVFTAHVIFQVYLRSAAIQEQSLLSQIRNSNEHFSLTQGLACESVTSFLS